MRRKVGSSMKRTMIRVSVLLGIWLAFSIPSPATQGASQPADFQAEIKRLLNALEQKVANLRRQHAAHPELGLNKIADSMEQRVKQLQNAGFSKDAALSGSDAAYVWVGNTVHITPNFFDPMYDDAARLAILLHEAVHLGQDLWDRKLKFWGPSPEVDAYKEEYKWLNVLGVGVQNKGNKTEIFNVLQALRELSVITADDKTQALDAESGLTPELITYFHTGELTRSENLAISQAGAKIITHENAFYSFQISEAWKIRDGDPGSSQERYVFLTREVKKVSALGGAVQYTYAVQLTLGEVLGANAFDPGVEKIRDQEMGDDQKFNFSSQGAVRDFGTLNRQVAGLPGVGYQKTVTEKSKGGENVQVTEKLYFKYNKRYYYTEFNCDREFRSAVNNDYLLFLNTLKVK